MATRLDAPMTNIHFPLMDEFPVVKLVVICFYKITIVAFIIYSSHSTYFGGRWLYGLDYYIFSAKAILRNQSLEHGDCVEICTVLNF